MDESQVSFEGGKAETPTQKSARLRRERREAKLKAEGTSRLEKISKVSGRQNLPDPPPDIGKVSSDPDEVDLSTHPSAARSPDQWNQQSGSSNGPPTEAAIRAMLRAGPPQPGMEANSTTSGEDPMIKMLSQLMGGMPGSETGGGETDNGGIPPGLAAMLGAGGMASPGGVQADLKDDSYGFLWKIVHAVFALCLGTYVTTTSSAFGQVSGRNGPGVVLQEHPDTEGVNLFLVFASVELLLQSTRFFLQRGFRGGKFGGWIGLMTGFLPEPYRGFVAMVGNYATILGTVVEDAMVVVFVVGCIAWWKGIVR